MRKIFFQCIVLLAIGGPLSAQIGVGTATAHSDLHINGAVAMAVRSVTANSAIGFSDEVILFTGTSAATVTLPDATGATGRVYWIKNASTLLPVPTLAINTTSSQTLDGVTTWALDEPNEVIRVVSDGSNWQVLNQNVTVRKTTVVGTPWLQGGNNLKSIKAVGAIENYGISFLTNNTIKMHLTNAGYLGLGTTNPEGRIHSVTDNDDNDNDYYIQDHGTSITQGFFIRKSRGTVAIPADLQNGDLISQFRFSARYNGSLIRNNGSGMDAYYTGNGTSASTDLRFFASNNEVMRVHQSGYVGVGTSTFDATNPEKLVVDAGTTASYNVISGRGDINNYLQLNIRNTNTGNTASSDIVASADNGSESGNYIDMGINSSGYSNSTLPILDGVNTAYVYGLGADMKVGNAVAYDVAFFTGGFALTNERLRIANGGNIGIGVTAPSDKLTVAGIVTPGTDNTYTIGKNGARWSAVYAANGTIQTSDIRLKKNIQLLDMGLNEVLKMHPVTYHWKDGSDTRLHVGLIAQEVRQLVPEVVSGNEATGKLGMNYAELIPILIRSLQQQQQKLKELNEQIEALGKK